MSEILFRVQALFEKNSVGAEGRWGGGRSGKGERDGHGSKCAVDVAAAGEGEV